MLLEVSPARYCAPNLSSATEKRGGGHELRAARRESRRAPRLSGSGRLTEAALQRRLERNDSCAAGPANSARAGPAPGRRAIEFEPLGWGGLGVRH